MSELRVPPHSTEAEQSVIGGLLLDSEALHRVPFLAPEAFYSSEHADIFRAIQSMAAKGAAIDPVTVFEQMAARRTENPEFLAHLTSLAQYVPSASNIRRYAEIVMERWAMRRLAAAGDEIAAMGFQQGVTPAEQVDKAQMLLAKLAQVRKRKEPQHIHQSLAQYLELLQDLSEGKNPALATGLGGLDRLLNGGLRRGELMVIGARPKHGKTALALAVARSMARRHSVLFISQEMPVMQLMHRHTAAMANIDLGRILSADAGDSDLWTSVAGAAERLGELNLLHDEQAAQSLFDVRRKAIQVKRQYGLDVLVVDFLQLMQGGGEDTRNRELDVIANGIKALALDLEIAVILLSQMSREADKHYGPPVMTHLRDSGAIEAAADQVALLFTDHAHPMSKRKPEFSGYSELEIVAHRNGPRGLVPLQFLGHRQEIGDWTAEIPLHGRENRGGGL